MLFARAEIDAPNELALEEVMEALAEGEAVHQAPHDEDDDDEDDEEDPALPADPDERAECMFLFSTVCKSIKCATRMLHV